MRRRRFLFVAIALLLVGVGVPLWSALEFPPPGLLLACGLPPAGGPTGRKHTVLGLEFVEISSGYFRVGSHEGCEEGNLLGRIGKLCGASWGVPSNHCGDECPPRWVEIERPFWIARTEVPNEVYERFDPSREGSAPRLPASSLSWNDARAFCRWLTGETGFACRLPSEAEWEYACRAGTATMYSFGDSEALLPGYAWFAPNSGEKAHPVSGLTPNPWGLFDMHGNVSEWVADHWHCNYAGAPSDGRAWVEPEHEYRVVRGGAFSGHGYSCRSGRAFSWIQLLDPYVTSPSLQWSLDPDPGGKVPMVGTYDWPGGTNLGLGPLLVPDLKIEEVGFRPVLEFEDGESPDR